MPVRALAPHRERPPFKLVCVIAHKGLELLVGRASKLDWDDAVEAENGEQAFEDLAPGHRLGETDYDPRRD
jgi:hypothetical protein